MLTNGVPIHAPLIDNGENQVPEDGLEEEHARNEVAEDVDGAAEVAGVDVGEAEGVGHLRRFISIDTPTAIFTQLVSRRADDLRVPNPR